jgi:hypothetical protein
VFFCDDVEGGYEYLRIYMIDDYGVMVDEPEMN